MKRLNTDYNKLLLEEDMNYLWKEVLRNIKSEVQDRLWNNIDYSVWEKVRTNISSKIFNQTNTQILKQLQIHSEKAPGFSRGDESED